MTLESYKAAYVAASSSKQKAKLLNKAMLNLSKSDSEAFIKWQTEKSKEQDVADFEATYLDEVKAFLKDRPLLTQRGLSLESGISESMLGKILRGERSMTAEVAAKLEPVLRKYGFL
ncbi:MAG: hypothetical protein AAGU19_07980 [Prolixibacteraceae bacterium]